MITLWTSIWAVQAAKLHIEGRLKFTRLAKDGGHVIMLLNNCCSSGRSVHCVNVCSFFVMEIDFLSVNSDLSRKLRDNHSRMVQPRADI